LAIYSTVTGLVFLVLFVLASVGFSQVAGLVDIAGLFQRTTLTIGWVWLMLLAVHFIKDSVTAQTLVTTELYHCQNRQSQTK